MLIEQKLQRQLQQASEPPVIIWISGNGLAIPSYAELVELKIAFESDKDINGLPKAPQPFLLIPPPKIDIYGYYLSEPEIDQGDAEKFNSEYISDQLNKYFGNSGVYKNREYINIIYAHGGTNFDSGQLFIKSAQRLILYYQRTIKKN